jgi:hypothetical protein
MGWDWDIYFERLRRDEQESFGAGKPSLSVEGMQDLLRRAAARREFNHATLRKPIEPSRSSVCHVACCEFPVATSILSWMILIGKAL